MPAGVPSLPLDTLVAQRFLIQVDGTSIASFQEVSGITSEIEVVELKANDALGKPILKKMIGATKPPTITLKRAADSSMDLWNWHKAALEGDLIGARKNGSIVQLDFIYGEVARYNFFDAWVSKLTASGMKAGDNAPAVEEVTIVCERLERVK
ncbi:MAG TPA: phage tail protein [Candidatus Nanopelagicales bacterium]|nr:phage tail protein [Candidatus Nanopelagicales bacterium]